MAPSLTPSPVSKPEEESIWYYAALYIVLAGALFLAAGIVIAIDLAGWAAVGAVVGGAMLGALALMVAVFTFGASTETRFNSPKLIGLLAIPGGVALALAVGGLLGVGLGLSLAAVGAMLFGIGCMSGGSDQAKPARK